jgi:hypothetical protein
VAVVPAAVGTPAPASAVSLDGTRAGRLTHDHWLVTYQRTAANSSDDSQEFALTAR